MNILIAVRNKIATAREGAAIVCGNSDYTLTFDFDDEWATEIDRTARFSYRKNEKTYYKDVSFTGNSVAVPILSGVRRVSVGVYAGSLHTSTPATIVCVPSILCDAPSEEDVPDALWLQIQGEIGNLENLETENKTNLVAAINEARQTGSGATNETDPTVPEWAKQPNPPSVDIPTKLPNPHALTIKGAVNAIYDGSEAVSVEIPTDEHINELINTALGVIENGTY